MAASQGGIPEGRPASKNPDGRTGTCEEEIDLLECLTVLWRWKYFIIFGTVVPSLLVYAFSVLSPTDYRVTCTYAAGPGGKTYLELLGPPPDENYAVRSIGELDTAVPSGNVHKTLFDRFYSEENIERLTAELRQKGFAAHAGDISLTLIRLEASDSDLAVTMIGTSPEEVQGIAAVVRDNLEKIIPLYFVKEHLGGVIIGLKTKMADIEQRRFGLELELEREKAVLARLRTLASADAGTLPSGLVVHIQNVYQNSEFLPLPYQIQAADVNVIHIEQTIRADQEKYNYYMGLLSLNEGLLAEARDRMSSRYTMDEFHSFLTRTASSCEGSELKDYLSAYIKRLENTMSAATPVVEKPKISAIPRGSLRKSGTVFVVMLMTTVFGSFPAEAIRRRRQQGV